MIVALQNISYFVFVRKNIRDKEKIQNTVFCVGSHFITERRTEFYPVGVEVHQPNIIRQGESFLVHQKARRDTNDEGSGCQQ